MSQIYAPSKQGRIAMFREALQAARARGDASMVRAMRVELASLGDLETTQAERLEEVVPEKPRRGRHPMPRCEHDVIVPRCPECYPEDQIA